MIKNKATLKIIAYIILSLFSFWGGFIILCGGLTNLYGVDRIIYPDIGITMIILSIAFTICGVLFLWLVCHYIKRDILSQDDKDKSNKKTKHDENSPSCLQP